MRKTLIILLLAGSGAQMFGQVTTVRRYNPNSETAKTETVATPAETAEDKASRRAAALSKVQGASAKSTKAPTTTAKGMTAKGGVRPTEYSTDDATPVEYNTVRKPSTTMTVNGLNVERNVRKGKGQVGDELFTPVSELFYVQFAVYCKDTPVDKAPPIDGLLLLWHAGSQCPGGEVGASYIVKGYNTAEEAKAAVTEYKASRIDCWYNPALTGAEVEVIGVR